MSLYEPVPVSKGPGLACRVATLKGTLCVWIRSEGHVTKRGERVGHSGFGGFVAVNLGYCVLISEVQCHLDINALLFICTLFPPREQQKASCQLRLLMLMTPSLTITFIRKRVHFQILPPRSEPTPAAASNHQTAERLMSPGQT